MIPKALSDLNLDIRYRPRSEYPWPKFKNRKRIGVDYEGPPAFFVYKKRDGNLTIFFGRAVCYRRCDMSIRRSVVSYGPHEESVDVEDIIGFQLTGDISISRDPGDGKCR